MESRGGFLHLNVDNRWPLFRRRGLELGEDGVLRLGRVPLLPAPIAGLADLPAPDGPAGVAVGRDGTVWHTDPGSDRLLRIDPCDSTRAAVPVRLRAPRGLLLHPTRNALLVADSGNRRVVLLDPETLQLLGVWDGLGTPWTLAGDPRGNVYVVDREGRTVRKIGPRGDLLLSFGADLDGPTGVTVGEEEVYVLDAGANRIVVFDAAGRERRRFGLPPGQPLGLLFAGGRLHLGDNAGRRLLVLKPGGALVGEAEGFEGPVAALAPDARGGLWLHPGGAAAPVRLLLRDGHVRSGVLWGGPLGNGQRPTLWHEIETQGGPLVPGAHLQLFFHKAATAAEPPDPGDDPIAPFDLRAWTPFPPDALRGLIRGAGASRLWIGAHFTGEGRQTPVLEQIRLDFDVDTWARNLPAIYRTRAADPELLERFLALFESLFTDVEGEIGRLGRRFDAAAAPADWLPWLADWLGLQLDETRPEEARRRAIAGAFAAAARRGTPAGLREAVRFATGVDAHVDEPILHPVGWSLPADGEADGGRLGFDTVLAAGEPEGAVAGTTAVLGGSHLADVGGPGSHLYEALAHQFCVQVRERQVADPRRLAAVRAVIEREKPAHAAFHLCVVAPRLRIGFQARLGIDTVVAGPAPARPLGYAAALVLGGPLPGRVGDESRIGSSTRLSAGAAKSSHQRATEEWP